MKKRYALVADTDVFYLFYMDDEHPIGAKWMAALDTGVTFLKVNNYAQVRPGFLYNAGNFYDPEDIEMKNPLPELPTEILGRNQYAGIVENDVVGLLTLHEEENPNGIYEMVDIGMQSNPIIVEYTNHPQATSIAAGWTYDGTNFYPPQKG